MRHFNSRLVCKSFAFSKELDMHCAATAWEDLLYNLARPLKSLRLPETDPHNSAGYNLHPLWPLL